MIQNKKLAKILELYDTKVDCCTVLYRTAYTYFIDM